MSHEMENNTVERGCCLERISGRVTRITRKPLHTKSLFIVCITWLADCIKPSWDDYLSFYPDCTCAKFTATNMSESPIDKDAYLKLFAIGPVSRDKSFCHFPTVNVLGKC